MNFKVPDKLRASWIGIQCDTCGKRYCIKKALLDEKKGEAWWECPRCLSEGKDNLITVLLLALVVFSISIVLLWLAL